MSLKLEYKYSDSKFILQKSSIPSEELLNDSIAEMKGIWQPLNQAYTYWHVHTHTHEWEWSAQKTTGTPVSKERGAQLHTLIKKRLIVQSAFDTNEIYAGWD